MSLRSSLRKHAAMLGSALGRSGHTTAGPQAFAPGLRHMQTYSERDIKSIIHSQTDFKVHAANGALVMEKGKGIFVYDDNGKEYIEGLAGLWCASLGFSEKRLAQVAYEQMLELPYYHTFSSKSNTVCIELAEKLISMAPAGKSPLNKVYFGSGGGDSNDSGVKIVWNYFNAIGKPDKKKLIGRVRGYHGSTVATVSLSGQPGMHEPFDMPFGSRFLHTNNPHYYRFQEEGESEEDFATRMADDLEALIVREGGADQVAAMWAEPMQGAGGVIIPPRTYWEKVQAVLDKYEVLLVADEVITGFGRTGNFWGCQTFGIKPDILTCAKQLSASYMPISALLVGEHIYDAVADYSHKNGVFGHGYTYSGHPVPSRVALETLKIYEERNIVEHVRAMSPAFVDGMHALRDHPLVGNTTAIGLVGAVEIVQDKATRASFAPHVKAGAKVAAACEAAGLIPRVTPSDRVALCPPLIISEDEIDLMIGRLRQGLDDAMPAILEAAKQ